MGRKWDGGKWDVGVGHVYGHVTISTTTLSPLPALKSERKDLAWLCTLAALR